LFASWTRQGRQADDASARRSLTGRFIMRLKFNSRILTFLILAFLIAFGFKPAVSLADDGSPGGGKLKVVATTSIIGDWVNVVGGDDVEAKTLVGADGDPHEYEPVPADSISLSEANLVFENGFGLETWLDKLYDSAQSKATRVVITDGVEVRHVAAGDGERPNGKDDDRDPHAWQSVKNAVVMVGNIRDALVKADPSHAADYKSRTDAYIKQLNELDAWVQDQINLIPAEHRKLVTSHVAFGYFGQRYGVDISRSGLESVTTEAADPSARQIAEVVEQIKASGVPVIFLENVQNPKLINQIAAEAKVKVGPPLYSDALGEPGTDGDSYVKMIRYNVQTLVRALGQ
jgi:zinc/manganese transport system substrate-binding protein